MRTVIVGASLAGLRTAEALRMRGYDGEIVLIGDEADLPYDRPPLSKAYLLPDADPEALLLRKADAYAELSLDLRLGTRGTRLDLERQRLHTDRTDAIPFDHLVIATGARARRAAIGEGLEGFHTLRTMADADALRAGMDRTPRVLVLGGGFIGAEVAAVARSRGLDVTIVEALAAPLSRALGTEIGHLLTRPHRDQGIDMRCGVTATEALGSDRVEALRLSDGSIVPADLVVVGLGVEPATAWLADSGLDIANGVLCDARLRASGHPNIFAVGDVARWPNATFGETMRIEHWTNANEHADIVASAIMGEPREAVAVPYVWSDQYGRRIQIVGRPMAGDEITLVEDAASGRHVAAYERDGRFSGLMAIDTPRAIGRARKAVRDGVSVRNFLAAL